MSNRNIYKPYLLTYFMKKIKVGDIEQNYENQKILKQLFYKKGKKEDFNAQNFLDSIDTEIKKPKFEK